MKSYESFRTFVGIDPNLDKKHIEEFDGEELINLLELDVNKVTEKFNKAERSKEIIITDGKN